MKNVHGNSLTKEDMLYKYVNNPDKYIITFKNILRVYNGLNCYGISNVEEVV